MSGAVGQNDWRVQPDNTLQVVNPKTPQRKGIVSEVQEPQKNYRGLLIAWLIIFVVLLAVVISVVIIGVRDPRHVLIGRRLTVPDVLKTAFRTPPFFAAWRGVNLIYKDSENNLREYNSRRNSSRVIFRLPKEEPVGGIDTLISSNGKYVLERRKIKYGLRGSSEAQYTVQDVTNGHQFPVHLSRDSVEDPYLQMALFSPRQRRRPSVAGGGGDTYPLAVVHRGDIYLLPSAVQSEGVVRLTDSGTEDRTVLNGLTNWWYGETQFGTFQALWFSESGSQLMFVTFNDSALSTVDTLTYPRGGEIIRRKMTYPKRNGALTEFSISICDMEKTIASNKPHIVELQLKDMTNHSYLTEVQWIGDETVAVSTTARDLNSGRISLCTSPTWRCLEVYAAASRRWVNELRPVFAGGRSQFVVRLEDTGEHGTEMVEIQPDGGVRVRHKTEGHTISDVLHWDWEEHWIYYTGVEDSRPSETQLFRRPDSAARRPSAAACLSCHSPALADRRCDAIRAFFPSPPPPPPPTPSDGSSSDVSAGISDVTAIGWECTEGPVRSLQVVDRGLQGRRTVLDTSEELVAHTSQLAAPHLRRETIRLGGETVQLEVMLPKLWDEKKGGSYLFPFVLDIGDDVLEPNWSQQVATFMVSKWDLVFVRVKSSAHLSRRSFFDNQKRTSHIFSHLLDNYPYLDATRTAVLGTGFGGHSALVALADSPQVDCGAVMWPVVELDLYDAYHAERYEDTTNILDAIERLSDHSLYLAYGTGDPLFLHGDLLSKKLVEAGVLYYQQIYSDEDVYFRSVTSHFIKSLEDFLIPKCFPHLIAKDSGDG